MRSSTVFAPDVVHESSMSVVSALQSTGFVGPVGPLNRTLLLPPPLVAGVVPGVVVGTGPPPDVGGVEVGGVDVVDDVDAVVDVVGVAFL
jgi:hypothetical protein